MKVRGKGRLREMNRIGDQARARFKGVVVSDNEMGVEAIQQFEVAAGHQVALSVVIARVDRNSSPGYREQHAKAVLNSDTWCNDQEVVGEARVVAGTPGVGELTRRPQWQTKEDLRRKH